MDKVVELLMYVNYVCNSCGHKWESKTLTKNCQERNGKDINHVVITNEL